MVLPDDITIGDTNYFFSFNQVKFAPLFASPQPQSPELQLRGLLSLACYQQRTCILCLFYMVTYSEDVWPLAYCYVLRAVWMPLGLSLLLVYGSFLPHFQSGQVSRKQP